MKTNSSFDIDSMAGVNKENLAKMAEHLKTVPEKAFTMRCYVTKFPKNHSSHPCATVGCVIGHCINIDPVGKVFYLDKFEESGYSIWSVNFVGISKYSSLWSWLFSSAWTDIDDTISGAIARIEWFLKHDSVPKDWKEQISGTAKLCYTK